MSQPPERRLQAPRPKHFERYLLCLSPSVVTPARYGREHAAGAGQRLADLHLGGGQPGGPLEDRVGQVGQVLLHPGDAEVEVHLVVVGGHVGVGDRPVLAVAVVGLALEVVVREAEGEAAPDGGLAAEQARADPRVARPGVRVVLLVHHDVLAVVGSSPALHVGVHLGVGRVLRVGRLADRVLVEADGVAIGRHAPPPRVVVGPLHRFQLALDVELLARLQQQHLEAARGEGVGGHAPGGPRAHDHRVVDPREIDFGLACLGGAREGHHLEPLVVDSVAPGRAGL